MGMESKDYGDMGMCGILEFSLMAFWWKCSWFAVLGLGWIFS
jgi:hypothetical protein